MSVQSLATFIEARCKELKISKRKASMAAVNSPDFIRHMKAAKNAPKTDKLFALARVLSLDPELLFQHVKSGTDDFFGNAVPHQKTNMAAIPVVGSVQAGVFAEALEWDVNRRYILFPAYAGTNLVPDRHHWPVPNCSPVGHGVVGGICGRQSHSRASGRVCSMVGPSTCRALRAKTNW